MRRTTLMVATLLLAACSAGTATTDPSTRMPSTPATITPAPTTPAPTTPATIPHSAPSTPSPAPGATESCSIDVAISGGLTLMLSTTAPGQLGWSGEPLAWGFGVDTPTPFDVHLADGSTLPMTLSLGISDQDGEGPQAPTMGITLRGPESSWPSPTPPPNGTPPPEWTPLPYSRQGPIVMVNLYWTSGPLATESFPPGQGEVVFNGRFAATFDVTFPYVDVRAMFVPATSVVRPGDISARGTVSCG